MSLAINPLKTVRVVDPVLTFNEEREFSVLTGGSQISWKPFVTTSYSNSSFQFTAPPPSPGICVDRKFLIKVPVTINFTGTSPAGQNLLQSGYDAFRAFPISSITNTLAVTINNSTVSINMADVIQPLLRYHTPEHLREFDYSITPTMMDQFQNYFDGYQTSRNPLNKYGDNSHEMARGGFPYTSFVNTPTSATVQALITEPIFLSPMMFGKDNNQGFIGVQTLDFNFTFISNLSRIWSHAVQSGSTFTSVNVTLGQPTLLFKYVTPKELQFIPKSVVYPYFIIDRYPTDSNSAFTPGQSQTLSTNNIQLQSIPRRMYIFARQRNSDLTYNSTDTYFSITGISVNWNNYAGLLSSASQEQLYALSVKNGCNMSWTQWSGGPSYSMVGNNNNQYGTVGSVLALEFGTDIGMGDVDAPGLLMTNQLQMNVTVKNVNVGSNAPATITPTLYVVIVSEGTFTIENNRSVSQIGVISKQDVLDSKTSPLVDYHAIKNIYGGDFFSGFKEIAGKTLSGIQQALPYIKTGIDVAERVAPYAVPLLGLGSDDEGGALVGGKRKKKKGGAVISRNQLRNRLLG